MMYRGVTALEQFRERFAQPLYLGLVGASVLAPEALRHTGNHEPDHRAIKRPTSRRHQLHDRMAVSALAQHSVDRADLAFQPMQPCAQRTNIVRRQREWAGRFLGGSHDFDYTPVSILCILPGVC